ncbi:MAG: GlsB/YeaQ/YmgE family stress response membrane protein [Saprospiraceae bacterium]|nr:GlsB/YeaQ/YmgE family stress response membrane protein [Saprospiraceae bacterium]MCB9310714.1 GlsB/YeaQ/YmgE family stress response membrane protein [Lewinellaceae bacterium]
MSLESLLIVLVIGAVAGWLAGQIRQGYGFGLLGNIIIGIAGSFVGGLIFNALNISLGSGIVSTLISSVVGALVLLFLIGLIKRS